MQIGEAANAKLKEITSYPLSTIQMRLRMTGLLTSFVFLPPLAVWLLMFYFSQDPTDLGESFDKMSILILGWGSVPFLLESGISAILRKFKHRSLYLIYFIVLAVGLDVLDLTARYHVLFHPRSSTDAIATLFLPIYHTAFLFLLYGIICIFLHFFYVEADNQIGG